MNLHGLPGNFNEWFVMKKDHLEKNLEKSDYTVDLYKQYKKHLGVMRYKLFCKIKIDWFIKSILLPNKYRNEIKAMDTNPQNL